MVTSDTVTNNNIEFDGILNMRDLATGAQLNTCQIFFYINFRDLIHKIETNTPTDRPTDRLACSEKIAPGKFFRTGCVSSASPTDVKKVESLGIKVWIDLRSEPEVEEDEGTNLYT
jgi:Tyrosine phosphatase family